MTPPTTAYYTYDVSPALEAYRRALAGVSLDPPVAWLINAVRGEARETAAYEAVSAALTDRVAVVDVSDDLDEMARAETFHTRAFLVAALFARLSVARRVVPNRERQVLDALLHKFEVFGRIYNVYGHDLRKRGDRFDDPEAYALFALTLLLCFDKEGDLAQLNTALKVNDLLASLPLEALTRNGLALGAAALAAGENRLEQWYERTGFVLPADE